MSETIQIAIGLVLVALVFILTRFGVAWKMRRAATSIIDELRRRGADRPGKAVSLPYAQKDWLKIGLRDYRVKALSSLVEAGVVSRTASGGYYLTGAGKNMDEKD